MEMSNHKPLFNSIFGYQVKINLIKKTIIKYDKEIPKKTSKIWRGFSIKEITII